VNYDPEYDDPLDKDHEREEEVQAETPYQEHLRHGVRPGDFA
jgi:hypothetical protein